MRVLPGGEAGSHARLVLGAARVAEPAAQPGEKATFWRWLRTHQSVKHTANPHKRVNLGRFMVTKIVSAHLATISNTVNYKTISLL